MPVIPVSFESLRHHYPARPNLTPELSRFMSSITGTPCCVQMSHSLNLAGQTVPQTYAGQRRNNSPITTNGRTYYYLLAVDELNRWLTLQYGAGEAVHTQGAGGRTPQQVTQRIQAYLQGRSGILVFRDGGYGFHTELWDGRQIVQRDMNEQACFTKPQVLFWDTGAPQWLSDYMSRQS